MREKFLAVLLIFGTSFWIACGGGNSVAVNNSANSDSVKSNANQNTNTSQPTNVDPTPLKVDIKDLNGKSLAELQSMQGRTLIFETAGVKNWTDEALTVGYVSLTVVCKGDFSEYKDSIKLFQDPKTPFIYADFKGTAEKIEEQGYDKTLYLKNCVLTNLEK